MNAMTTDIHSAGRRRRSGFTLIEILVAVVLLSGSLAAMMTLWSVSRRITERTRDTAEYYAVARAEMERVRVSRFDGVFNAGAFVSGTSRFTDYDQNGNPVSAAATSTTAGVAGIDAPCTANAYYRVESTYTLTATNGTAEPEGKRLGRQVIKVYRIIGHTGNPPTGTGVEKDSTSTPIVQYQTVMFYTSAGA